MVGLNPRLPLDDRYRAFLALVADQVGTALVNARAYEAERTRAEGLAQLDRAKTVFFSNVSHEFRTPLSLMLGPTEEALASPDRALSGEALEIVHRNELRLLKLVNTLLDFSASKPDARTRATCPRTWPSSPPTSPVRSARRSRAPAWNSSSTVPRCRNRSSWTGRCGRRSSSTSSRTP